MHLVMVRYMFSFRYILPIFIWPPLVCGFSKSVHGIFSLSSFQMFPRTFLGGNCKFVRFIASAVSPKFGCFSDSEILNVMLSKIKTFFFSLWKFRASNRVSELFIPSFSACCMFTNYLGASSQKCSGIRLKS